MNSSTEASLTDAAAAIGAALEVASLPVVAPGWVSLATVVGLTLAGSIAGSAGVTNVLKRGALIGPFILFLAILEFFRGDMHVATEVGGMQVPLPLVRAVDLLLKTFTAACLGLAWGERVGAHGIARTLHRLRAPAGAVATTFLATNFLATISREWEGVRMAAKARGLSRAPFTFRLRLLGSSLMSVLVRSIWRGDRVGLAMQARGYCGRLPDPLPASSSAPGNLLLPLLATGVVVVAVLARTLP